MPRYLQPVCERLVGRLMTVQTARARISSVTCLSAVASVAKKKFVPFAPQVRGIAVECLVLRTGC